MKELTSQRPDVFSYLEVSTFLRDWMNFLKRTNAGVSLRRLAKEAGVANGYLPMILSGKRPISQKVLAKLSPHLHLKKNELSYLRQLQIISESEDPSERLEALNRLRRFETYEKNHKAEIETYQYLTKWFYVAIREMCQLKDFKPDPAWIQKRLNGRLGLSEVVHALDFLKGNGFLKETPDGRIEVTHKHLDCKEGIFKISLGEFHRQMLFLASESIEKTPRAKRTLLCHTTPIRMADVSEVREILNEALKKIEDLSQRVKDAEEVYHIELAAFPLTKSEPEVM